MKGKICIVTGANSGVGKVTARELLRMGADVTLVSRDAGRGGQALEDVKRASGSDRASLMLCDFASQRSIRAFAREFRSKHDALHVLVNNAGGVLGERRLTEDGIEATFAINHLGYFLLTLELLDLLKKSAPARIVNVSSEAHRNASIDFGSLHGEKPYKEFAAYGQSKLANICFTAELARRLEGTGVTANSLHPGVVATNFGSGGGVLMRVAVTLGKPFLLSADKGAATQIHLATSAEVEGVSGKYFVRKRAVRPSIAAQDEAVQRELWRVSEDLVAGSAAAAA